MVNYKCPRCGFETNHKGVFKKHLIRKNICQPKINDISIKKIVKMFSLDINLNKNNSSRKTCINIKIIKCKYCGKIFSSRQSKSRHELNSCNITNESKTVIDKLTKKVKQLEKVNLLLVGTKINNLLLNNSNSTKLPYNDTDNKFISDSKISECMTKQYMSIPHLIKMVHFDPKHPENHNIYVGNIQSKHILVYNGSKWVIKDKNEMIDNLISNSEYKLKETLGKWIQDEENKDKYSFAIEKFKKYLEMKDNNKVINNIKDEIKLMLYNNRELCKDYYVHIEK
jgi:hypothetical protein